MLRKFIHYLVCPAAFLLVALVRKGRGKNEHIVLEYYRKLEMPATNETFDTEFENGINAWAEANVVL